MSEPTYELAGQALLNVATAASQSADLKNFLAGMRVAWGIGEEEEYQLSITGACMVRTSAPPVPALIEGEVLPPRRVRRMKPRIVKNTEEAI